MTLDQPATPSFDLDAALTRMVEAGASDLHLKAGNRPLVRVDGKLVALDPAAEPLRPRDTESVLQSLLSAHLLSEFERCHELDFAHGVHGLGRFRVNAYRQRGTVALVLRAVARAVPTIEELGLPDIVRRFAEEERGLILVTGVPGSGRSTTVAAMLEHINLTVSKHVVTIEDPIEFLFKDNMASIDQREVGVDTASFTTALRQVLRQDPDVIFVGELRDAETAEMALAAAAEGHLVLSTLEAAEVPDAVNGFLDLFGPDEHVLIRPLLAANLKGIVAQRLVPMVEPAKRLAVTEVLTITDRVRDALLNPRGTSELVSIIAGGEAHGMHTSTQALHRATTAGLISMSVALAHTSHPHDLRLLAQAGEQRERAPEPPPPVEPVVEPPAEVPVQQPAAAPAPWASTPPPFR
jgi:twitching motility protein PilT